MKAPAVYILSNSTNCALYIGVTSNLVQRIYQHKNHLTDCFTKKYKVDKLFYFESLEDMENAIKRENTLKKWNRDWKIQLIKQENPTWKKLWENIMN